MRPVLVTLGLVTLAGAWLGAFERLVPGPFSAHMSLHMTVVAVAAPLLAFGVAGGALDPVRRWPAAFPVIVASIAELILVWGWHSPALHQAARDSRAAFVLEQASFSFSGLWLWLSAVGGQRRERAGAGIVALLLTCMHMTLLGALLALPPRALYAHGSPDGLGAHAGHERPSGAAPGSDGLAPLADQHLGGAIMIVLGGASYLAGGLWLAFGLLGEHRRDVARAASPLPSGAPAAHPTRPAP